MHEKYYPVVYFSTFNFFSENKISFPEGRWEGFQDLGVGGNAVFIMRVDSKGNGFYGYSLKGKKEASVCMPISKAIMRHRTGYYEQTNTVNELKFVVVFAEELIFNNFKAITLLLINEKQSAQPIVWDLVLVENKFLNQEVESACKQNLKVP